MIILHFILFPRDSTKVLFSLGLLETRNIYVGNIPEIVKQEVHYKIGNEK